MTREEEKREAAKRYATHDVDTDETDFYGNYIKKEDFVLPEYNAFIEGCKWSDANPKSLWISVKDDLPCNHEEMVHINPLDQFDQRTSWCLVSDGRFISIDRMYNFTDKWRWGTKLRNVTYWSPLPKLPKD